MLRPSGDHVGAAAVQVPVANRRRRVPSARMRTIADPAEAHTICRSFGDHAGWRQSVDAGVRRRAGAPVDGMTNTAHLPPTRRENAIRRPPCDHAGSRWSGACG